MLLQMTYSLDFFAFKWGQGGAKSKRSHCLVACHPSHPKSSSAWPALSPKTFLFVMLRTTFLRVLCTAAPPLHKPAGQLRSHAGGRPGVG